ncbi:hypothetical protein V6N12_007003 [Hibiscus sabdariffa]|uniref:Endonuclease/exonuclease/phosphatase domain-containing protein n=1 Tax=Hibiscus sabdariffa TaxID=183260 RepID=A0ABR2F0I4_9ROSI
MSYWFWFIRAARLVPLPNLLVQLFTSGCPCSWCLILVVYRACWLIVELLGGAPVLFSCFVVSYCLWVTCDMAIVSWNVRGLGKSETIRTLKFLIDKHRSSVIFLNETKQHGKYLERKRVRFKFANSHYVHPCGIGGGLALWWNEEADLTILSSHKHLIDTKISINKEVFWFCSFVYGPPKKEAKGEFWDGMSSLRAANESNWCLIGDTNIVINQDEKFRVGLMEAAIGSDHCPIILILHGFKKHWKKEFKFESRWLDDDECKAKVKEAWSLSLDRPGPQNTLSKKLKDTSFKLSKWSSKKFGKVKQKAMEIRKAIGLEQDKPLSDISSANINVLKE